MEALVTGVAGFIGSHLAQVLLADGHQVRGVDCFTPYYDPRAKRRNLEELAGEPGFEFVEADLRVREPSGLLAGVDTVFHLAAQPGVRGSWAANFPEYAEHNLLATQRLLEGVRAAAVRRFVFASSSSVYGEAAHYPTSEDEVTRPHSPYGATRPRPSTCATCTPTTGECLRCRCATSPCTARGSVRRWPSTAWWRRACPPALHAVRHGQPGAGLHVRR